MQNSARRTGSPPNHRQECRPIAEIIFAGHSFPQSLPQSGASLRAKPRDVLLSRLAVVARQGCRSMARASESLSRCSRHLARRMVPKLPGQTIPPATTRRGKIGRRAKSGVTRTREFFQTIGHCGRCVGVRLAQIFSSENLSEEHARLCEETVNVLAEGNKNPAPNTVSSRAALPAGVTR
jgi:hypothetical protein